MKARSYRGVSTGQRRERRLEWVFVPVFARKQRGSHERLGVGPVGKRVGGVVQDIEVLVIQILRPRLAGPVGEPIVEGMTGPSRVRTHGFGGIWLHNGSINLTRTVGGGVYISLQRVFLGNLVRFLCIVVSNGAFVFAGVLGPQVGEAGVGVGVQQVTVRPC